MADLQDQTVGQEVGGLQNVGGWVITGDVNFQSAEKGKTKYDLKTNGEQTSLSVTFTDIEKADQETINLFVFRSLKILYGDLIRSRLLKGKIAVQDVLNLHGTAINISLPDFLDQLEEEEISIKSAREMTEEEKRVANEKRQRTIKRKILTETGMFTDEQIEKLLNGEKV